MGTDFEVRSVRSWAIKRYNFCILARTAHVGEFGAKARLQVLQNRALGAAVLWSTRPDETVLSPVY